MTPRASAVRCHARPGPSAARRGALPGLAATRRGPSQPATPTLPVMHLLLTIAVGAPLRHAGGNGRIFIHPAKALF
jgi:hypothetical protein